MSPVTAIAIHTNLTLFMFVFLLSGPARVHHVHHDDCHEQSVPKVRRGGLLLHRPVPHHRLQCHLLLLVAETKDKRRLLMLLLGHYRWIRTGRRSGESDGELLPHRHDLWRHRIAVAELVLDLQQEGAAVCQPGDLAAQLLQQLLLDDPLRAIYDLLRRLPAAGRIREYRCGLVLGLDLCEWRVRPCHWLRDLPTDPGDLAAHAQRLGHGQGVRSDGDCDADL